MPAPLKAIPCRKRSAIAAACLLCFFSVLASFFWPLNSFEITPASSTESSAHAPLARGKALLGRDVTSTIIHSVQLTPVIDIYRVQEGKIWAWREKIQSHNAGLPSGKPDRGRFLYDAPWMIVEGGGASWREILYRVGDDAFGKNRLCVFQAPCRDLWREVPGKLLVLRVASR